MMSSDKSGGGTGTLDRVEFGWLEWDPEGSPVSIHMSPGVAEGIAHDSVENTNEETGGLLLGQVEAGPHPAVWIERYQQLPRTREGGGGEFILDSEEIAALESAAGGIVAAGEFAVVGLYRSHRRPGFQLEGPDFDLMRRYFRDPSDLILLVRPGNAKEVTGRFHVRDEQSGARAITEVPLSALRRERENAEALESAPALPIPAPEVPDTAIEAPREKPRRLVPDFAPTPKPPGANGLAQPARSIEPPPSVFGLSTPAAQAEWSHTDEFTAEQEHGFLKRWLPLFAALAVVGGVLWFFLQPGTHLVSNANTAQTTEPVRPLGLFVDAPGGPVWQVSWNPNATALHGARNVRLFVRERSLPNTDDAGGDNANPIDLSPQDLASGNYQYRPAGNDVTFRLEVTDQSGRVSAESFRLERTPAPAPPAAPKPEEAPAERPRTVQPKAVYRAPAVVAAGVRSRIKGVVPIDIRVQIDTRGHVTSATPVARQHSGIDEYLAARAVQAARQWRFEPARENGKAVEGSQILHFVFEK